jgi:hypothetical protein
VSRSRVNRARLRPVPIAADQSEGNQLYYDRFASRSCRNWGDIPMLKVALIVWIVLGTTLMGIAVAVITSVPGLYAQGMKLIPIACAVTAIVALPLSFMIASKIMAAMKR